MAAMTTIMKPLAGATPVVSGVVLPSRTRAGNCQVLSRRGQLRFGAVENFESTRGVRVVARASEDTGGGSLVGQTPTSPIDSKTEEGAANLPTAEKDPSPLQNGASEDTGGGSSLVGQTATSPIKSMKEQGAGNSATEIEKTSPLQNGGTQDVVEGAAKEPETLVGQTPTSPIESKTEGDAGNSATKVRKASPLQKGGTLDGDEAAGKDPAATTLGKKSPLASNGAGKFVDPRWSGGTWDITKFTSNGKINWDAVIDAEVMRRKWLEENPEASTNSEPVVFDTATVPWWAWVKRFHLPEAELLNGRAAMVGYAAGYLVDSATGYGLVDQQSSFLGKLLIFITVLGVLLIRKSSDVESLRTIAKESTFYDKQWQATWKDDDKEN